MKKPTPNTDVYLAQLQLDNAIDKFAGAMREADLEYLITRERFTLRMQEAWYDYLIARANLRDVL